MSEFDYRAFRLKAAHNVVIDNVRQYKAMPQGNGRNWPSDVLLIFQVY